MNDDNRRRVLAEIVSLDAWHDQFSPKHGRSDLHVDVAFTPGRIGGSPGDTVRFKLRLRRAQVVVIIPPTEPATVVKGSVSRDTPKAKVKATETSKTGRKAKAALKAQAKAGAGGSAAGFAATMNASASRSHETALTLSESLDGMRITQSQTADGDYVWEIEPAGRDHLVGHPWEAAKQPRLAVNDTRPDRSRGIEPTIRVEVRCLREDLEITEIAPTDPSLLAGLLKDPMGRNKLAAAEAVIRTRLFQAGLFSGDMSDPYARMSLSAVISEGQ